MTTEEFNFYTRHPGGFDRQFFVTNLPQNHASFLAVHNLTAQQVRVKVTFETGEEVDVISARPALTWVALDTEDHETRLVPRQPCARFGFCGGRESLPQLASPSNPSKRRRPTRHRR
jgi:hypothetical protein